MIEVVIISGILLVVAVLLLGIKVFFQKDGKFPNTHIGGNKAMQERGIGCATSQDRQAQKDNRRLNTTDLIKKLEEEN